MFSPPKTEPQSAHDHSDRSAPGVRNREGVYAIRARARRLGPTLTIAAGLLIVLGALVWISGAVACEFGAHDRDEPAHFVTGLLIRDYIVQGFPANPMRFAQNYYVHYPKVAFGAWPPLFHIIEAAWLLIFPPSHAAVLLLVGFLLAVSAVLLFGIARDRLGVGLALFGAFAYVLLPVVQYAAQYVWVDGLISSLELLAMVPLARYIDTERPAYAYWFGVWAALGTLSKANAFALLLVLPIAVLVAGKGHLLRTRHSWLALAPMLVAPAPLNYFLVPAALKTAGMFEPHWVVFARNAYGSVRAIGFAGGVFLPLAAVGMWRKLMRPSGTRRSEPIWSCCFALVVAVFLFHAMLPVRAAAERRYFVSTAAPLILFALAGIEWIAEQLPLSLDVFRRRALVASLVALAFLTFQFRIPPKTPVGFAPTATRILAGPKPQVVLVCGNGSHEGMVVAELAMRGERPGVFVLRASKVLAQSDWFGHEYQSLFDTAGAVAAYLDAVPVDHVLIDAGRAHSGMRHHELLLEALRSAPDKWKHAGAAGELLEEWERVRPLAHGAPSISFGMRYIPQKRLSN